jgi:mono/diheme cytochrome c family protein
MAIQTSRCKPGLVLISLLTLFFFAFFQNCTQPTSKSSDGSAENLDAAAVQKLYTSKCGLCHGADGKLNYAGAKDLSISSLPKDQVLQQIKFGKGAMPPQKDILSDKEIELLTDYTLGLRITK